MEVWSKLCQFLCILVLSNKISPHSHTRLVGGTKCAVKHHCLVETTLPSPGSLHIPHESPPLSLTLFTTNRQIFVVTNLTPKPLFRPLSISYSFTAVKIHKQRQNADTAPAQGSHHKGICYCWSLCSDQLHCAAKITSKKHPRLSRSCYYKVQVKI